MELCDPLSGSVLESVFRVHAALAGLTGWTSQRVLADGPGQHLRVDFCFQAAGLVVEVDGAKWQWAQVVHRPDEVVDTVRVALARTTASTHLPADRPDVAA